jgi:hypothetical protein
MRAAQPTRGSSWSAIGLVVKIVRLQRRELEYTREELKGQKLALSAQNETLQQQNFENTFLQLLRLQSDIVNATDLINPKTGRVTKGRECMPMA